MAAKSPPPKTPPPPSRRVLVLEGLRPEEERPVVEIAVHDQKGEVIHRTQVGQDGAYSIPDAARKRAHRVVLGPPDVGDEEEARQVQFTFRAATFLELEQAGRVAIARDVWLAWLVFLRCVSGRVRRCQPGPWWFEALAVQAVEPQSSGDGPTIEFFSGDQPSEHDPQPVTMRGLSLDLGRFAEPLPGFGGSAGLLTPARTLPELLAWPFRCAPVCDGRVEVYRRTCCCRPWVIFDPRLPELVLRLRDLIPRPLPGPFPDPQPLPGPIPGPTPGPGPDPGPQAGAGVPTAALGDLLGGRQIDPDAIQMPSPLVQEGALDESRLNAARDLRAIQSLGAAEVAEYIRARPYLFCGTYECSAPVQVASGTLNPDGRFNICWRDFRRPLRPHCSDRYAYVVRQRFGPFWITVYDGRAANQWFTLADSPTLTTYHPLARTCRTNPGGAFVFLNFIGQTGAWDLHTPDASSAVSVQLPADNSGLVSPNGAMGPNGNRNWGGTLRLNLMIAEGMKAVGARFYRVSVCRASPFGTPVGTRHTVDAPVSWRRSEPDGSGGVNVVAVALGPQTVNGQSGLYTIPFDSDGDWDDGQFHARLDTTDPRWNNPAVRHLVTVEIFDGTGRRLRPQGRPATGLGGPEVEAAFTFRRRFQDLGPTAEVPFGALTHMFWWDNRNVAGQIADLRRNGLVFTQECLFLTGTPDSTFGIGYRAYHPNERFQRFHNVWWRRGLGTLPGNTGALESQNPNNVGVPPAGPGASATNTFAQMLRTDLVPTRRRCAFTVFLRVYNRRTDGWDLSFPHTGDTAAFVLEIGA